jgi:hypothetical protein
MNEMLDDELLSKFIQSFYGYGNYRGQFWFIGMEEGGGSSFSDISTRLNAWSNRDKKELEDLKEYHDCIGVKNLFNDKPQLQPTWNKLIRILLSSREGIPTTEQVRAYQKNKLGRLSGETCLLELLPLPSPSIGQWIYAQHSKLPHLIDRESYEQNCITSRIAHLQTRIREYRPKVVIFYSLSYQEYWKKIAGMDFQPNSDGIHIGYSESTLFVIIKHPAARGIKNEYFHQVGKIIANSCNNKLVREFIRIEKRENETVILVGSIFWKGGSYDPVLQWKIAKTLKINSLKSEVDAQVNEVLKDKRYFSICSECGKYKLVGHTTMIGDISICHGCAEINHHVVF